MIIDVHVHPVLFGPICTDSDRVNFRKKAFGLYKSSPVPMEQVMAVMDHAGVDRAVILAEDYSASNSMPVCAHDYKCSPKQRILYQKRNMDACTFCKGLRRKERHYI